MHWTSVKEIPDDLRVQSGVPVSLSQANMVLELAESIGKQNDIAWQRNVFQTIHEIRANSWVRKELTEDISTAIVEVKESGAYKITTVSTVALPDRDRETFSTEAMDYDIQEAERTNKYPEFRVFHDLHTGFGKVEKMSRVGIFMVDEGTSYTDPFSIAVCEKMLANNSEGKWKVSRGFFAREVYGKCPQCDSGLLVQKQHLTVGFRCPACKSVYLTYKRVFKEVQFRKVRTFDVSVTDIPAVPWTGASATKLNMSEDIMTKKELKERLLKAGLPEDVVTARLSELADEQLKEYDGIPDAVLLKEFGNVEETLVLDQSVLKEIADKVEERVHALLDGLSFEIAETKEASDIAELKEEVAELKSMISQLLEADDVKVKKEIRDMSRESKLRVRRYKPVSMKEKGMDEESEEEMDEEESEDEMTEKESVLIASADGKRFGSMTEMVLGNRQR